MTRPNLLFVSRTNAGKSQMAAALARQIGGGAIEVTSAGTSPAEALRPEWASALREVGAEPEAISPVVLTEDMVARATHIIRVGVDAPLEGDLAAEVHVWDVDLGDEEDPRVVRRIRAFLTVRVIPLVLEATGQPASYAGQYDGIADDLTRRYEGIFTRNEVLAAVRGAHAHLAPTTRVPWNLPIFVERLARRQLREGADRKGAPVEGKPEVLFLCVNNAGRSQLAAAMAIHFSGGAVNARSAGARPLGHILPLVREVLVERGIECEYLRSEPIDDDILRRADVVVNMAGDYGNYGRPDHRGKRYVDWDIPDPWSRPLDEVRRIADQVEVHVRELLEELY